MMRKLLTFLKAVAIATLIAGCGGTGTENEPEITPEIKFTEDIVTSGISVESAEQSITLSFSSNVAWSATVSANWLTISPSSGEAGKNSVKVEVEENRTGQPRSATITISDKESTRKVSVTVRQEALKASLTVSPESLEFSANKGEEMLNVTSNTDWVITKDAEWITLDSDKGKGLATIAAGVTENTSLTSRTGTITVSTSDGSVKKTVSVRQSGADVIFTIDKNEFNVAAVGESFSVKVTRNIGYKINSQPEWVKQPDKANSGNVDTYTFTAEANTTTEAREGVIVFCNDNNECVPVTVKQVGANATLSVSPAELTFTAKAEAKSLDITSNTAWTATSSASWAKINAASGNGNAQVTVTAEENTAITQRSATITIKTADGKATATVKVTQSAANVIFSVDRNEFNVAAAGESFSVKVTHNIGYKINSMPDWVKQTNKTTSGNTDTFTFKAEANTSTTAREGVIVFCNDNNECVPVTVKQVGANATLSVSPAELTFTANTESKSLNVTSNTAWTATSSASWAKINAASGNGNAQVTVTAEENTAITQRSATVTIKTADGKASATVKVTQSAANVIFSVDRNEFNVAAAGESFSVKVTHNIGYKINSQPEWVKQTGKEPSGNTDTYTFTAEANTSTEAREGVIVFCNDNNECVPVTVKQVGANATLSVSPASMTFTAKSESKTFTVTSNTDWTMTSDAAWVKLSATDGSGNAQVTVTAEENTATKQRIATITLKTKDGKTTATVKLSQNGADIIFRIDGDNREYKVEAEGGEIQFSVIHNIECYLKKNPEWVILDNMQTYNGATWYKLKVIPNTSTTERGGKIVIRGLAENECELEILVIQAAGKPKGGNENTTTGGEITIE